MNFRWSTGTGYQRVADSKSLKNSTIKLAAGGACIRKLHQNKWQVNKLLTFAVFWGVFLHYNAILDNVATCDVLQVKPHFHGRFSCFNEDKSGLEWSEDQYWHLSLPYGGQRRRALICDWHCDVEQTKILCIHLFGGWNGSSPTTRNTNALSLSCWVFGLIYDIIAIITI